MLLPSKIGFRHFAIVMICNCEEHRRNVWVYQKLMKTVAFDNKLNPLPPYEKVLRIKFYRYGV